MKNTLKITCLLLLSLGCLVYSGCKKELKNSAAPKDTKRLLSGGPTREGDMLVFATYDEYDAYEDFLMEEINKSDGTKSEDEILQEIEDALGFTSLRKLALADFEAQNAIGWTDPKDIPAEHWITSKITRAILNPAREVKIGDKILHYVNENYLVTIAADAAEMIGALRDLPPTATLPEILSIDLSRHYMSISNLKTREFFDVVPFGPWGPGGIPLRGWYMNGYAGQLDRCIMPMTVNLTGFELWDNLNNLPNKGRYYINWGDGTPVFEILSSEGTFGTIMSTLSHTYATPGMKTITVSVVATSPSSSGGAFVETRTFNVNVIYSAICHDFERMDTRDYSLGTSTFVRGHIKYEAWYNALTGVDKCKVLSYTECYVSDDAGVTWHRFKANWIKLCAKIKVRELKEDCTPNGWAIDKTECSYNTYTRYAEAKALRFHWAKIEARHEAYFHDSPTGWDHVIMACE